MRKSTRIVKRLLALFLVVLMSINTLGAVVSDNDGSAFITKAEFDSLKNDFQSQINQYNTSLDAKIDGAIASYLAGISVVKQQEMNILVPNYDEMMWINTYKVYGKWRKWTSSLTTCSQQLSNVWFVPSLGERRMLLRNGQGFYLFDEWRWLDGNCNLALDLNINSLGRGAAFQQSTTVLDGPNSAPVGYLVLEKDNDGYWKINTTEPFQNYFNTMNFQWFNYHTAAAYTGNSLWAYKWDNYTNPNIEVLVPSGNEVLAYKLTFTAGGAAASETSRPTFKDFLWPAAYEFYSMFEPRGFGVNSTYALAGTNTATNQSEYLAQGVTWHWLDDNTKSGQVNLLTHLMFGKENDTKINVGLSTGWSGGMMHYDFSSSDDSIKVIADCQSIRLSNTLNPTAGTSAVRAYTDKPRFTLNLPKFPVMKFAEVNSNYFEYKDRPLKIGEGLPIIENITSKGIIHLSCDYEVKHLTETKTENKIYVDVADNDFLQTNVKYVNGYIGNVDINNTSSTAISIHNTSITNSNKKLELTIPVEAEQDLWLRVAPQNDTGGYYVQLKNLRIFQEIE